MEKYYHGLLPREDVLNFLHEDGDFIVRKSQVAPGQPEQYIISVMGDQEKKEEGIKHLTIAEEDGKFIAPIDGEQKTFKNVVELVKYLFDGNLPVSGTVVLKKPIPKAAWELSRDKVKVGKKLGEGAFGDVCKGELTVGKKKTIEVAIKQAKIVANTNDKDKLKEVMREARTMRNFDHPNVVKMYGVVLEDQPLLIVMEFINGTSLDKYLKDNDTIPSEKAFLCLDCARGIAYLHTQSCMHRDIAARNCLYDKKSKVVKISDFGLSHFGSQYVMKQARRLPIKWMAPETLETGEYVLKSDVFSFAILVVEIYTNGEEPYKGMGNNEVMQMINAEQRMELPPELDKDIVEVITNCWTQKHIDRWDMETAQATLEKICGVKPQPQKSKKPKKGDKSQESVDLSVEEGGKAKTPKRKKGATTSTTSYDEDEKDAKPSTKTKKGGKKGESKISMMKGVTGKMSREKAPKKLSKEVGKSKNIGNSKESKDDYSKESRDLKGKSAIVVKASKTKRGISAQKKSVNLKEKGGTQKNDDMFMTIADMKKKCGNDDGGETEDQE
ncbi:hypothetical protein L596_022548 [Steinernema carpocapsae]|uniref:Tyrosine-protein kinase n=1 Tax=Steinernema carpocapsae TaxID=34508 RepID=A0A4U5MM27_STECR|nr:hypothetical protein L596_022548 [Steinernema carpocapsae]